MNGTSVMIHGVRLDPYFMQYGMDTEVLPQQDHQSAACNSWLSIRGWDIHLPKCLST